MAFDKEKFKEQLLKKPLLELDTLIYTHKQKITAEKNLLNQNQFNTELQLMIEVRDKKLIESGRHIQKNNRSNKKPELKSYDDYIKSKNN